MKRIESLEAGNSTAECKIDGTTYVKPAKNAAKTSAKDRVNSANDVNDKENDVYSS